MNAAEDVLALPSDDDVKQAVKDITADRKNFIGSSDAPVILGISNWKTPFELFQEKTGAKEQDDLSEVERVQWGIILEDAVAQMYMRRTGKKVRRVNDRKICNDFGFPMVAQIDRAIVGEGSNLEIKTTDTFCADQWGEEGSDDIPLHYYAQIQHQMAVTKKQRTEVAVLIGGNKMKLYHVDFHEEFVVRMIEAERSFWQSVQTLEAPDPVTIEEAAMKWAKAPSIPVYGTHEDGMLAARYKELAERIKSLESEQDEVKLELQKKMQDLGDTLIVDGAPVATWKNQTANRLDVKAIQSDLPEIAQKYTKASESRVFKIGKGADNFRRTA